MKALELKIPPVVLVALFALAMWLLAQVMPTMALPAVWGQVLAAVFAVAGIAVALSGVLAFRRADTTVDPRVPQ
jgi:protein-S-isoprenylcysteine O-methyltransferase Ste14